MGILAPQTAGSGRVNAKTCRSCGGIGELAAAHPALHFALVIQVSCQSSTRNPCTRPNSGSALTMVRPCARAIAAILRSFGPIIRPWTSSWCLMSA